MLKWNVRIYSNCPKTALKLDGIQPPSKDKTKSGLCMPKNAHTYTRVLLHCITGYTFNENHRIESCSDSCIIQIWQSISLIELCSRPKCSSFSEIWRTETKVSPAFLLCPDLKKKQKTFFFFFFLKVDLPTPSIFMPKGQTDLLFF